MPKWFSFGGISSANMTNELIIHKVPALNRSERKIDVFSVPGRDGDIILPQDAWKNQTQEYDVYIGNGDAAEAASELVSWLYPLSGYQELRDAWETDVYRMACFSDPMDIESIMGKVGHVVLTFSCIPKRFLVSGQNPVTLTASDYITNPTVFTAKPLIRVSGTAGETGTIVCGGKTLGITIPASAFMIDCETRQAYSADGTTFYNSYISGEFPEIPQGSQRFGITGSISSVTITPRWFRR